MEAKQILLVEDNPDDEFLELRALRRQGLEEVVVARDGEQAISLILGDRVSSRDRSAAGPWLVLLDLKLPKVDGIEVLRAIRSNDRTRDIPVIVISSSCEGVEVQRCRELGVTHYFTKPLDGEKLVGVLREAGLLDGAAP
ncbi:response regulator [Geobacter pickeringii]|uniref:Chemotaxis protein CheY n=1 Tax=Geobacter pickeringii TaxID=345632 RepID=A0A0B5BDQ7_9BACT|nr:response regulator [Geobacter pickeringii]AJE04607.1 chemotaxis protein CheY [Geobacter pickeringii]